MKQHQRQYVVHIKNKGYQIPFMTTDDVQAKLYARRVFGNEGDDVSLFRIAGRLENGDRRLKGIEI